MGLQFAIIDAIELSQIRFANQCIKKRISSLSLTEYKFDVILSNNTIYKCVDAELRHYLLTNFQILFEARELPKQLESYHKFDTSDDNPTGYDFQNDKPVSFFPEEQDYQIALAKAEEEGRVLAYVNDEGQLIINNQKALVVFVLKEEYAAYIKKSVSYVKLMLANHKIDGMKTGNRSNVWLINLYSPEKKWNRKKQLDENMDEMKYELTHHLDDVIKKIGQEQRNRTDAIAEWYVKDVWVNSHGNRKLTIRNVPLNLKEETKEKTSKDMRFRTNLEKQEYYKQKYLEVKRLTEGRYNLSDEQNQKLGRGRHNMGYIHAALQLIMDREDENVRNQLKKEIKEGTHKELSESYFEKEVEDRLYKLSDKLKDDDGIYLAIQREIEENDQWYARNKYRLEQEYKEPKGNN